MTPEETAHCQEAIKNAVRFAEVELSRLRGVERQFNNLLTMLEVLEEEEVHSMTATFKITKANAMTGESWRQIVERALVVPARPEGEKK